MALLGGDHLRFLNVRRLIFLSCARQITEMQRVQVEISNEEVRNPPGAVSLNWIQYFPPESAE